MSVHWGGRGAGARGAKPGNVPTILSSTDKATNLIIGGTGLTATYPAGDSVNYVNGRGTQGKAGKRVFEARVTAGTNNGPGFGIANASAPLGPGALLYGGIDTNSCFFFSGGNGVFYNNATQGPGPVNALNGWVMVVMDTTVGKMWLKYTDVNDPAGSDPVTNTLGYTLPAGVVLYPFVGLFNAADAVEVNFGTSGFTNTVPTGFTAWNS